MRFGLAAAVILNLIWNQQMPWARSAPGLALFQWIIYANAVLTTFAGPLLFANAITEEKEERTLALLRVADVGPLTILTGKALPRLAALMLVLIVQFPFTLLAITLGGVTFSQVLAAYLAIAAFLVFVGMLAIFCSVLFRSTGNAVGLTGFLLLAYFFGPLLIYAVAATLRLEPQLAGLASLLSDVYSGIQQTNVYTQLAVITTSGFDESPWSVQVVSNLALGLFFFGLGWAVFDFFNRDIDAIPVKSRRRKANAQGESVGRRVWNRPVMWKEFVYSVGGQRAMIAKSVLYLLLVVLVAYLVSGWNVRRISFPEVGAFTAGMFFFCILPMEMTLIVARLFNPEVKGKTLSTLLMLPYTVREIGWSKIAGGLLALIPAFAFLCLGILLAPRTVTWILPEAVENPSAALLILLHTSGQIVLYWHFVVLLSLSVNVWWAMFLAAVLQYYGMLMVGMFGAFSIARVVGLDDDVWTVLAYLSGMATWALVVGLHFRIGYRLRIKAAET